MKQKTIFLIFCVILALTKADSDSSREERRKLQKRAEEMVRGLAQECKESEEATDDDIEAMIRSDENPSQKSKCLRKCMLQSFEILSAEGTFCTECIKRLAEMFVKDQDILQTVEEIAEKCNEIQEDDLCELAHKYGICMKNEALARGLYEE